jgi:ubiquinone/menaquinone biosynthesis C-methylase UbiE
VFLTAISAALYGTAFGVVHTGTFVAMLRDAGFADVSYRRLSIGVVALHTGTKPP